MGEASTRDDVIANHEGRDTTNHDLVFRLDQWSTQLLWPGHHLGSDWGGHRRVVGPSGVVGRPQ